MSALRVYWSHTGNADGRSESESRAYCGPLKSYMVSWISFFPGDFTALCENVQSPRAHSGRRLIAGRCDRGIKWLKSKIESSSKTRGSPRFNRTTKVAVI